jgi:hypothetical protein
MKRFLHILALILSALTVAAAFDITGIVHFLPEGYAAVLVTVPPMLLAISHFVMALGDQLDDGQKNNSFPGNLKMHPVTFLLACGIALCAGLLNSCSNLPEGFTVSGYYRNPNTGAKATINTTGSNLGGGVEIPIYDTKGHQTGWVDLHSGK